MFVVDIGNSRIKWGLWQSEELRFMGAEYYQECSLSERLDQWFAEIPPSQRVIVANVASQGIVRQLDQWFQDNWQVKLEQVHTRGEQLGLSCAYTDPASLGVDRWLAMLAAHHRYSGAVCVIDCGTAVTLDVVADNGRHLGGLIMPGLTMMRDSLLHRAEGIANASGQWVDLADNTPDAVFSGSAHLLSAGLRQLLVDYTKTLGEPVTCVITGGDGETLAGLMNCDCQVDADLILYGLRLAAQNQD